VKHSEHSVLILVAHSRASVAVILSAGRAEINAGVLEAEQEMYFTYVPQIRNMQAQLDRIEYMLTDKHSLNAPFMLPKKDNE